MFETQHLSKARVTFAYVSFTLIISYLGGTALDSRSSAPGSSPGRDIVLCSWARHFTLRVPLSTQVYKWVPANFILGGNPAMD